MAFCLPKKYSDKFLAALREGKIVPEDLIEMTSEERRDFLKQFVGEENVREVNAQLESKLILKDQKRGLVSWAKKTAGLSDAKRTDLLSRIEKLDHVLSPEDEKAFFEDLAAEKLGTDVTVEEAKTIADLSRHASALRDEWDGKTWSSEEAQKQYGAAQVALTNYVNDLKLGNEKTTLRGLATDFKSDPVQSVKDGLSKLAGISKGIKASLDDSAIFRQGWRTLFTDPRLWAKNAVDSFKNIAMQIGRKPTNNDVINGIKADIYSRPNAMNGLYQRMKLDIGTDEEAFPTSIPEKIPFLGRLYKASEVAYTGFLYRMRADIADKYIRIAENSGFDFKNDAEVRSMGKMINSLTGRGDLGSLEKIGKQVNTVFFSPKALKASVDFLTGHNLQKDVSPFVRKQAAINLLKVVAGTAVIMATAQAVFGKGSVETDPRSSDFGKIKIGDTRFDISGGMASIVTLAARLLTLSTKSTTTHKVNPLNAKNKDGSPRFGAQTGMDVVFDFATNKASPAASVVVDYLKGQTFSGQKPTVGSEAEQLFVPLPATNAQELLADPNAANPLLGVIADSLGIATNTYAPPKKK